MRRTLLAIILVAASTPPAGAQPFNGTDVRPELPRVYLDTDYSPPRGRIIPVKRGGDFQAALNAAQSGDVITLEAGAVFTGQFTLPPKHGPEWITVRTSAPDSSLPPPGSRIDPSYASVMPKLETSSGSVIAAASGAHHFRFIGLEIRPTEGVFLYNLVDLGVAHQASAARFLTKLFGRSPPGANADQLPHHIIFDRCYLHGDRKKGTRRGIALNSRQTAVIDSYFSDFKEVGADSQAIAGWNGPGPFKIVNNYLEGAGENVIFGGADPTIPGLVPADIEIRHNHIAKPLSWMISDPTYEGTPWTVKNLLELKNARRLLVEGNLFERNWAHAQTGFAILFTVRNQDGQSPWSVVEDVTFADNVVRHTAQGMHLLGRDYTHPSDQTKRILIKNNLFDDVGASRWGGGGRLFMLQDGTADVVIDHNTAFQTGTLVVAAITISSRATHAGFVFTNNIAPNNEYGIGGDYTFGDPLLTLSRYFPGSVFTHNVLPGGIPGRYPPHNFFPASLDLVGFVDYRAGSYRLSASSPYRHASTDGRDAGADLDSLAPAFAAGRQPISAR